MENINYALFLRLNAPEQASHLSLLLATVLAEWLIWVVPLLIGWNWLRGSEASRKAMLLATASGVLALGINQLIGLLWMHPRPFMTGLGHTFIPHAADSSFPSDHLGLWWAVAFSFMLQSGWRNTGVILALLGLPIAWARIYLGVHYPFDMLGAAVVAAFSAWLTVCAAAWYLPVVYRFTYTIHQVLFGALIRRGWVSE